MNPFETIFSVRSLQGSATRALAARFGRRMAKALWRLARTIEPGRNAIASSGGLARERSR